MNGELGVLVHHDDDRDARAARRRRRPAAADPRRRRARDAAPRLRDLGPQGAGLARRPRSSCRSSRAHHVDAHAQPPLHRGHAGRAGVRARRRPRRRCARRSRARDAGRRHTRLAERLAGGDDAPRVVPAPRAASAVGGGAAWRRASARARRAAAARGGAPAAARPAVPGAAGVASRWVTVAPVRRSTRRGRSQSSHFELPEGSVATSTSSKRRGSQRSWTARTGSASPRTASTSSPASRRAAAAASARRRAATRPSHVVGTTSVTARGPRRARRPSSARSSGASAVWLATTSRWVRMALHGTPVARVRQARTRAPRSEAAQRAPRPAPRARRRRRARRGRRRPGTSRRCRGTGPRTRRAVGRERRQRAEDDLVERVAAAADVAADEVRRCAPAGRAGPSTWRARMRSRKPGAKRSTCASMRSTWRSASRAQSTLAAGRACRPRRCACPPGARVGSATDCWPRSRNGRSGSAAWAASALEDLVLAAADVHRAGAARASGAAHGIGPSSAQSTFSVAGPERKRRSAARVARRRARRRPAPAAPRGIDVGDDERRARPARRRRCATPVTRPRSTAIARRRARRVRTSPPSARRRPTSASASRSAPPAGLGQPTAWPSRLR